jgi:hypothetical protein
MKVAAERDEELRTMWELKMAQYQDPELFVAIDKSAVDNKTIQCQNGWSSVGQTCVCRMAFLHGKRYSILPALSTDGIIALDIFEGSVLKTFLSFLKNNVVSLIYTQQYCAQTSFNACSGEGQGPGIRLSIY